MHVLSGKMLAGIAAMALGAVSAVAQTPTEPPILDRAAVMAALDPGTAPGTILIARGDRIVFEHAFGPTAPDSAAEHTLGQIWRWASVTKQVTATIAMQEVAAGRLDLDAPIIRYLPDSKAPNASRITTRMLLQHVSGLPRTDEGPAGQDDWSTFYSVELDSAATGRAWCEGPTSREPLAEFFYGDCDFIMAAAVIEATSGKPYATLIAEHIAQPLGLSSVGVFPRAEPTVPGYIDGKPEYGFAALGQWSFSVPLKDCGDTTVRIVERRGFIGGVVLRNIILPDLDMIIIMTSNRAEAEAAFGEIWQQAGITHDVMRAAVCATGTPL